MLKVFSITLASLVAHSVYAAECNPTYEGQVYAELAPVGNQVCQVGEKKEVLRYDMFNGGTGSQFYWDETYDGYGISWAGPISPDGSAGNTDPSVKNLASYSGLMGGTGQLTDGEFPTTTCCSGGGTYPDPTSSDYPYVAWSVTNGYMKDRTVPITFFFDGLQNIDFLTLSLWTRAGTAYVCSPSAIRINGEYYDLSDTERSMDLTNFHIQIALRNTLLVDHVDVEIVQKRTIPPDTPCYWIFLSEMEFHSCGAPCL